MKRNDIQDNINNSLNFRDNQVFENKYYIHSDNRFRVNQVFEKEMYAINNIDEALILFYLLNNESLTMREFIKHFKKEMKPLYIKRSIYSLIDRNLISIERENNVSYFELTVYSEMILEVLQSIIEVEK